MKLGKQCMNKIRSLTRKKQPLLKKWREIPELENTIPELKNSIKSFKSKLDHVEEKISDLEVIKHWKLSSCGGKKKEWKIVKIANGHYRA